MEPRAWGADGENALYLFDEGGYRGCRVTLELVRFDDDGNLLDEIRASADHIVGPGAGASVKCVAFLRVVGDRPLVGAGP